MVLIVTIKFAGLSEATTTRTNGDSQSDSLSPSSSSSASSGDATKGSPDSDDNGGFVTPPSLAEQRNKTRAVKRATVVGNPMFSNSPDSDAGPNESLGLDDLDMDYEQIMNYFDNLKVRELDSFVLGQFASTSN